MRPALGSGMGGEGQGGGRGLQKASAVRACGWQRQQRPAVPGFICMSALPQERAGLDVSQAGAAHQRGSLSSACPAPLSLYRLQSTKREFPGCQPFPPQSLAQR